MITETVQEFLAKLDLRFRPICPKHEPQYKAVCHEGGIVLEITCPNCNFYGIAHPGMAEGLSQ